MVNSKVLVAQCLLHYYAGGKSLHQVRNIDKTRRVKFKKARGFDAGGYLGVKLQ